MRPSEPKVNIPIEILRSVVAIAQTGSLTRASRHLNLSQPAISAQLKRLQSIIGEPVFDRSSGILALTERGKTVLALATRLLDLNDQIAGRGSQGSTKCRVGIASLYLQEFLQNLAFEDRHNLTFMSDHSSVLARAYDAGSLDIVCLRVPEPDAPDVVMTWEEPMCWVRSPSFASSPGKPIPIVSWPNDEQPAARALNKTGQVYNLVFTSPDPDARNRAVAAGLGIMATPCRHVRAPILVATDEYLPALSPSRFGILARSTTVDGAVPVLDAMRRLAPKDADYRTAGAA